MEKDQDFKQDFSEMENKEQITLEEIQKQISNQTNFLTSHINRLESQIKDVIAADQNQKQIYVETIQKLEEQKLLQKIKLGIARRDFKELHQKNQKLEKIVKKLTNSQPKLKPPLENSPTEKEDLSTPKPMLPGVKKPLETKESKVFDLQTFPFETVAVDKKGLITKRIQSSGKYFREILAEDVNLDMIYVPKGTFTMGTDTDEIQKLCNQYRTVRPQYEQPQHQVSLNHFLMAKYPVTQAQWRVIALRKDLKHKLDLNPEASFYKGNNLPMEKVSWHQAKEYCLRLSRLTGKKYRLPSEAEWEYACRARTNTPFCFGESITTDLANFNGNYTYDLAKKGVYRAITSEVGIFFPNAFGLYDLHGNVWEWCEDSWHDNYKNAPTDGSSWVDENNDTGQKVLRGGSWYYDPMGCRSAYRFNYASDDFYDLIGFRPVCEIK